jgi:microcin C transport system permease protein
MRDYFARRLLLIPPTLLGITLIVFLITRIVPGGPIERAIMESKDGGRGGRRRRLARRCGSRRALRGADEPAEGLLRLRQAAARSLPRVARSRRRGDLGTSYRFNEPVLGIILERMPGLPDLRSHHPFLVYHLHSARHPEGHQAPHLLDNLSSALIFTGYAIPGYALGAVLVVYLAARRGWFPMGGFVGRDFSELSLPGKLGDFAHHAGLPLLCYSVGSFALVTLLMKNHLMDNLAADFVRTAVAKGVSFRGAVIKHAFRNSLIPIATHFGQHFTMLVTGSFLIEFIFDIDGMGLLGYTSVVDRDYPTVMGVFLITSLLLLIGNIVSDILVAWSIRGCASSSPSAAPWISVFPVFSSIPSRGRSCDGSARSGGAMLAFLILSGLILLS